MVKELRERTGLGMMECKKALEEAGGDMEKAEELLRIKSGAKASKAASRVAAGRRDRHLSLRDGKVGALVEVNAETDFVAKNPDFAAVRAAKWRSSSPRRTRPTSPRSPTLKIGGETVESVRQKLVQKIGENIAVRRFERIQAPGQARRLRAPGRQGRGDGGLEGDDDGRQGPRDAHRVRQAQVHVEATQLPADVIAAERKILEARAAESGKPAEIVAKMVEGGINKFLGENTLLGQPFVKDDKQTVEKMLAAKKAKLHGLPLPRRRRRHREEAGRLRRGGRRDGATTAGVNPDGHHAPSTGAAPAAKPNAPASRPTQRILLKLSGEALMGDDSFGINREMVERIVAEVKEVSDLGVQVAVVIGGGNIFRGVSQGAAGMDRATADYMGMLATVINALALGDAMNRGGLVARVQSALNIEPVVEPYIRGKAIRYLEEGKIVIFAAGTGNPFFTTDTAAALRGREMEANIVLKATKVDGVYTADPMKDKTAHALREDHLRRGVREEPQGDGRHGARALPRPEAADQRVLHLQGRRPRRVVMGEDEGTLVHN